MVRGCFLADLFPDGSYCFPDGCLCGWTKSEARTGGGGGSFVGIYGNDSVCCNEPVHKIQNGDGLWDQSPSDLDLYAAERPERVF